MDVVGKVMGSFNAEALKEPRGFIKILQWILSIFAFATTTSVNTQLSFYAQCPANLTMVRQATAVSYPFRIEDQTYQMPLCQNKTKPIDVTFAPYVGGSASSAEFYVFVGVIVFLYCMAALILYIFFDEQYRKNNLYSIGDFVVSCVLTALWLISSAAWAQGLVNLKYDTDLGDSDLYRRIPDCVYGCVQDGMPNYASLNVSIIFGFLNMVVWGGNLWFLYKETPWFKVQSKPPTTPTQSQDTDPQRI
ncbi:synaptophysin-like protein 1 [Mizuhopecten yessoensis]|uniref:Synaptophysin-like protein 1 n=1 Tax=Mizuhopecten yessoensis TaxID=6573 RepID=A0A210PYH5_MIZYE|nr:synaptophysin-like protein 1 [Mizuhopecten yessoensis]OWF41540.1 Synaptophysin-like protein 1 [Mizuhopecten yessoensis]